MRSPRLVRDHVSQAIVLGVLDGIYILIAYWALVVVSEPPGVSVWSWGLSHSLYYVTFVLFWCWEAISRGLWESARNEDFGTYSFLMLRAMLAAIVFTTFVLVLTVNGRLEPPFLAAFFVISTAAICLLRSVTQAAVILFRLQGFDRHPVLLIGANDRTAHLVEIMQSRGYHGYRIEGFLESDPARVAILEKYGIPHLGSFESLGAVLDDRTIGEVYAAPPVRSRYETIQMVERVCADRRIRAYLVADLFPLRIAKRRLSYVHDVPLVSLSTIPEAKAELALKRAGDLVGSAALLLTLWPAFVLLGLLIKLDSRGAVFYLQERVGQNKRRFKMWKFRSMRADAENERGLLEDLNEVDGPVFKIRDDPRMTRVGRFIRRYSLDEFPQLINVCLGQMSLVGPRPPLPHEVENYTWDQRRRLSVKPGMTGLWQVSGRNDIDFEGWVQLDLAYIDSWSLWQDFIILLRTFRAVLGGRGAS